MSTWDSFTDSNIAATYHMTRAGLHIGLIRHIIVRKLHTLTVFKRGLSQSEFSKHYVRTVHVECEGKKCKKHICLRFNGHTTAGQAKVAICEYLNNIGIYYDPGHSVYDPDAYELNYKMLGVRDVMGMNLFILNDDDLLNPADINSIGLVKKSSDIYGEIDSIGDVD